MADELGKITLFLSKSNNTFEDVVDYEKLPQQESEVNKIKEFEVEERACKFYCRQVSKSDDNPVWLDFVNQSLDEENQVNFNTYIKRPSGLLLIKWEDRVFAASFGVSSSSWLKKEKFESDFGIIVAMNLCGNKEVRQAKSAIQSTTTQMIDRQLSKPSDADEFGMADTEFLHYISAHLNENSDVTLQGKNTLTIKAIGEEKLTWDKLFGYARQFIEAYKSNDYKELFPNYPNLTPVSDEMKSELDENLVLLIHQSDFSKIHMAIPEFIADDEFSFSYSNNRVWVNNIHSHVHIEDLDGEVYTDLDKVTVKNLSTRCVYAYSHDENKILSYKNWSIYNCLIAEIELNNNCYVLLAGEWRKVDSVFYDELNTFVNEKIELEEIDECYHNLNIFCDERKQNREELFNNQYCDENASAILFDQAKLQIGKGRKNNEFCDIFELCGENKGNIIHVKKHGGSSAINHLFSQARFYCEAFLSDEIFLNDIRAFIDASGHPDSNLILDHIEENIRDVNGGDYRVKLWILYEANKDSPELNSLPLMAKYELKTAYEKLRNILKYNKVTVSMIPARYIKHKEARSNSKNN